MRKDRSDASLLKTSQKIVFGFVALQRSSEKLINLNGAVCSPARETNPQHHPITRVDYSSERKQYEHR